MIRWLRKERGEEKRNKSRQMEGKNNSKPFNVQCYGSPQKETHLNPLWKQQEEADCSTDLGNIEVVFYRGLCTAFRVQGMFLSGCVQRLKCISRHKQQQTKKQQRQRDIITLTKIIIFIGALFVLYSHLFQHLKALHCWVFLKNLGTVSSCESDDCLGHLELCLWQPKQLCWAKRWSFLPELNTLFETEGYVL